MPILRVTAQWTGFDGAPGYTTLFFGGDTGAGSPSVVRQAAFDFFFSITPLLPNGVTIAVDRDVPTIDESTGTVTSFNYVSDGENQMTSTSSGVYSAVSGAVINWNTDGLVNGRRVRGRTFIVPILSTAYDTAGSLTPAALSTLRDAATELVEGDGGYGFGVWSRPSSAGGGSFHQAVGATVPDMTAVLRSRRD